MAKRAKSVPVKKQKEKSAGREVTSPARSASPFAGLRHEIDRIFDEFTRGFPFGRGLFDIERAPSALGVASPSVDVVERDKAFEISAELPGMDEKDIEVTLTDDLLTIKGEKREEREEKKEGYFLSERRFGSFERSFRVPSGVDTGSVGATFEKGVLRIVLPKSKEAQQKSRKVEVKSK